MKELLFSCRNEKKALENILAFNQIKKCDEGIYKYNEEITQLKSDISNILEGQGIKENYIDLIFNYKKEIKELDTKKCRVLDLDKRIKCNDEKINGFNTKIKELEVSLENLKRVIFDSEDAKVIIDAQDKLELTNKRLADLYELVENLNNDSTTLMIEKEFIKNGSFESEFNTPEVIKVELSNELQKIVIEFERVIQELDLAVREEIEFCMKKISNREKEVAKLEDRKDAIVAEYPEVIGLDFEEEMGKLDDLFMELDSCFVEDECCDCEQCECDCCGEECECKDECNCTPEDNCGCIKEEPADSEEDENSAHEVSLTTDMVKVESIEKPEIELKEVEEASVAFDETINGLEEDVYDDSEEEKVEVDSFSTIGSVPYIFSEGESLESIAEKVYPSKDCWKAIYNYNKEEIDSYLIANGISNDEESINTLAADKYLFAGIQLNIPTDANYQG